MPQVDPEHAPLDGAVGYLISKVVNLAQLQAEIGTASSTENVNTALSGNPDDPEDTNSTVLWVTPPGIDPAQVSQVVADHEADPMWGVSEQTQNFNDLVAKIRQDSDLDLDDQDRDVLLKGLVLNFVAIFPSPSG